MNRFYYILVLCIVVASAALGGCFSITRVESDLYTITNRDTTIRETVRNIPGERDNGTIYPSTRSVEITRNYVQRDSTVERNYPAFLRYGGVEAAGFIAGGASTDGGGNGLFGLYNLLSGKFPEDTKLFDAYMYRLVPYEVRLRAFDDAPDWTLGTAAYEQFIIQRDSSAVIASNESLSGVLPIYVRKRFFFREEPPYVMVVPFLGLGLFPSQYVNLGATFDVGSYGGFNLRAYLGYIAGTTLTLIDTNNQGNQDVRFPYFGIGISALDFVNRTEELFTEWKDHDHSAIEVSVLNTDLVYSTSSNVGSLFRNYPRSFDPVTGRFGFDSTTSFPSGAIIRFATAHYPLPFADGKFFVGTSLFNFIGLSAEEIAYGFLPIRAGYRLDLIAPDLALEPFAEYTYHPTSAFHLGARASLKITDWSRMSVVAGYVNGTANDDVTDRVKDLRTSSDFSTFYIGVGLGLGDFFFTPEEVRRR